MKFTKMHGIGNDYIYINAMIEKVKNPNELAKKLSRRHFSIGSDGLVLILNSNKADFRMRMFNSDGSEAEMCGNAIRCVAKYVYDRKLIEKKELSIETLTGVKKLKLYVKEGLVKFVRVNMGKPILKPNLIPVKTNKDICINEKIIIMNKEYRFTAVSMGNPHCIVFMDELGSIKIDEIGPYFENNDIFPKKTNTEFVKIIDRKNIEMRVWERGAGETLACGTGASAVLVASVLNELTERNAKIKLLGGELEIEWDKKTDEIFMTGAAEEVFNGEINI